MPFHIVYTAVFGVAFLYSGSPFYCGGFSQWVGLDDGLSQVFLVREACVSVLVGGAGFLLSGVQWSVQ